MSDDGTKCQSPLPAFSAQDLQYISPPGGYAPPEPRSIAQNSDSPYPHVIHRNPQPIHILSTSALPMVPYCQQSELRNTSTWSPIANAKAAANVSYAMAVALTVMLIPVMCQDARLLVMLPVLLGVWHTAAGCQRTLRVR
jgi:hypothetical protein